MALKPLLVCADPVPVHLPSGLSPGLAGGCTGKYQCISCYETTVFMCDTSFTCFTPSETQVLHRGSTTCWHKPHRHILAS